MNPNVVVESVPGHERAVRIPLSHVSDSQTALNILQETFAACFEKGNAEIILDLGGIAYPSASLIALLIEATSRARRLQGDLRIVNLLDSAKSNLAAFSPLNYLSIAERPQTVKEQGTRKMENGEAPRSMPSSSQPKPDPKITEEASVASDEIAEDPIVERLQESLTEQPGKNNRRQHLRAQSISKNLYRICDFVTRLAENVGFDSKEIGKIKIAVYEASLNVIEHAYHSNPDNWIDIWVDSDEREFRVVIQDYGQGFDGVNVRDYNVVSAADHRQTGGFGLYIIRRSMDEIDYVSDEKNGNCLTLVKYLK